MEAPVATSIDPQWFVAPVRLGNDDDDSAADDDDEPVEVCANAMRHAALCVSAVTRLLSAGRFQAHTEHLRVALQNCVALWRAKFKVWQTPCGNHLNVPDALFVAACHLRVALMPDEARRFGALGDLVRLETRIAVALKEWDQAPAAIHAEHRSVVDECARAIVLWGSNLTPVSCLADTTLSLKDVSLLTMNVDVHQQLDNRARNTELPTGVAASSACRADENILGSFVRLASRYAFFTMLHHAAHLPCSTLRLHVHQRLAADAVRPRPEIVDANVARLYALFRARSRISMPESVHRGISFTIWKRLLSVGSMEASGHARVHGVMCVCARARNRNTCAWRLQLSGTD